VGFAFGLLFLLVAIWAVIVLAIALFNPKNLASRLYDFDKRWSRIGPVKLGIFAFSENRTVHRVLLAFISALMAIIGIAVFVSLT
jgi:hypothetical protein